MRTLGVLFFSLVLWLPLRAQFINDGGNIDRERYNFGFSLALNYGSFDVVKRGDYQSAFEYTDVNGDTEQVESLAAIRSIGKPGFSLGLLANLKLHRNFDLRFTPNIIFVDRDIEYKYWRGEGGAGGNETQPGDLPPVTGASPLGPVESVGPWNAVALNLVEAGPAREDQRMNIRFTNLQFPLLLKFKSNRQGNVRAYVIGGAKFCMDVTSRAKYDEAIQNAEKFPAAPDNSLFMDRNYFAWEAGIGVDLYYEFFKCSPELKISRSFNNILHRDGNLYSHPLASLFAELVQFTVHFE